MRVYARGSRSSERLRAMYVGGRANPAARRYARVWVHVIRWGLLPRRWVVLEAVGRVSGRPVQVPLGMARSGGRWYLVSMLGECNWTRNVRAADGRAVLLRRGRHPVQLREVPVGKRAAILRDYVRQVPGSRPHMAASPDDPLVAFEAIAERHPVFAIRGDRR